MTRMSKQGERRNTSPRKHRKASPKTGPRKDNLPKGFKEHANAVDEKVAGTIFVPKVC
jgi:hypothetical protein